MRDGRKHHNLRCRRPVVLPLLHALDRADQVATKRLQTIQPLKRFVVSKKAEHHVGFVLGEPLIGITKIGFSRPDRQLITRHGQIAKPQFVLRVQSVHEGLQPAMMLQSIGRCIANDGDAVALGKRQLLCRHRRYQHRQAHSQHNRKHQAS